MAGMINEKTVKDIIGRRKKEIHKGDCGRVLIAAGSEGMAGAAILAARSALRAGSGLVRTAIPRELFPIVQIAVPEATCTVRRLPIPSLADYDAVCAGPGLGEGTESIEFVTELLKHCEKPLILDADALNIIAHNELFELLRLRAERFPGSTVLTPHMGEAKRLLGDEYDRIVSLAVTGAPPFDAAKRASNAACGKATAEGRRLPCGSSTAAAAPLPQAARLQLAQALLQKTRAVIVLKGAGTIVAAEGREAYTNTTGNPGMASAGSGDVLSGIITGLAGQRRQRLCNTGSDSYNTSYSERITAFEAAVCAVYIHGRAGDLAAAELGEYGLTAGDLALYTAYALKEISDGENSEA